MVAMAVTLLGCSLAESAPSPSPTTFTGRVELADEGVALTLDPFWWAEPGPSYEGLVPPPIQEIVLQAFYEDGPGSCDLWVDRRTDPSSGSLIAYTAYKNMKSQSGPPPRRAAPNSIPWWR